MTRSNLYIDILPNLVEYLKTNESLSESVKEDISDNIALTHYEEAALTISAQHSLKNFAKIAKAIHDGLNDQTEIMYELPVKHFQVAEDDMHNLKGFFYKTSSLAVMPVIGFYREGLDSTRTDIDATCVKILELIWLAYKDNVDEMNYVWQCCKGEHLSDYFLLTQDPDIERKNWRMYSYAYFCYVNSHGFKRPKELDFNKDKPFANTIVYNSECKYEQYFDAYNVISESKYSEDILSRYLRMYQMLEYMAYRRALVDLTKGNIKENGFVRNVINKASKGANNEFDELKKGLVNVLPDLTSIISSGEVTVDMQNFVTNRLMLKSWNYDNATMWKIIYQLRNSIVHNKESELHFMYANVKVYEPAIDWMKLFVNKIEPEIVNVINDSTNTYLEFDEQKIRVY